MQTTEDIDIKKLDVETELNCGAVKIKLYKVPCGYKCNRNIVGEDTHEKVIWQVEDICPSLDAPFTNISFDNEKIRAYNWIGADYYIDIQTGKLYFVNKNRRPW